MTWLLAAITPTLPEASAKLTFGFSCDALNSAIAAMMPSMVSALWSAVNTSTGIALQS